MTLYAYGRPLPLEHGSPLRLAAPRQYGYKSIKFVTRMEFTGSTRPGWWSVANPVYPLDAPVGDDRFLFKRPPLKELWKGD
jgi:DMSO/TMAO reductase YedYZ molybdopterin-dependent catalytic subunit